MKLLLLMLLYQGLGAATLDADAEDITPIQQPVRVTIAGSSLLQIERNRFRSDLHNSDRRGLRSAGSTSSNRTNQTDLPAGWFGGFAKDESTYERSGVGDSFLFPEREAAKAAQHEIPLNLGSNGPPYYADTAIPAEWFEESKSGGPDAAWRTRYPPLEAFRRHGVDTAPFMEEDHHRIQHMYLPNAITHTHKWLYDIDKKDADWFNDNVAHYDDFGRYTPPSREDERHYWDWTPRSWTAFFGCQDPGCTATAELTAMSTQELKDLQFEQCYLHVDIHPTDYDDEYSREYVEWIKVQDRTVKTHCDPVAKGCEYTYSETPKTIDDIPTYPCAADVPIGDLLKANNGKLQISGKITDMVDECPVPTLRGNLLSGIVTVRCLTKPWPDPPAPPGKPKPPLDTELCAEDGQDLRCHEHGCTASTPVSICTVPEEGQRCLLTLKVYHTDFDNDHGSLEVIEWVKLGNKEIATNLMLRDGRNPCKEVFEGKAKPDLGPEEDDKNPLIQLPEQEEQNPALAGMLMDVDRLAFGRLPDRQQLPGRQESPEDCRRRGTRHLEAASIAHEPGEHTMYGRRRGPFPHVDYAHLRAAPDEPVEVISGLDVTQEVFGGEVLEVSGKISEKVDECGKDGYLFNAKVQITCQ